MQPSETPVKKRMARWKKILLIVLCSLVALALIVGVLLYIFVFSKPAWKIYCAAENTLTQLERLISGCENLEAMIDSVEDTYDKGYMQLDISYEKPNFDLTADIRYDRQGEILAGSALYNADGDETPDVRFSADRERLMFGFPRLMDKEFFLPTEELGKRSAENSYFRKYLPDWVKALDGMDLDLFTDISWKYYQRKHQNQIDKLIDSLDIAETKQQIEHTSGLTTYKIRMDSSLFTELFLGYLRHINETRFGRGYDSKFSDTIRWFEELLEGKELTAYVGIDSKDRLTALHLLAQGEQTESLTVVLSGKRNIFDRFGIWRNGESVVQGTITPTKDGLTLEANEYTLVLDDEACQAELTWDDKSITASFQNAAEDSLELHYGNQSLLLRLGLPKQQIEMISDDPTDLLNMGVLDWLEIAALLIEENIL